MWYQTIDEFHPSALHENNFSSFFFFCFLPHFPFFCLAAHFFPRSFFCANRVYSPPPPSLSLSLLSRCKSAFSCLGTPFHPRGGADKKEETEANTHMRLDIYYWSNTPAPSSRPLEPAASITCRRCMILRAVLNALWPFPPNTPPSAHPHFLPFPLISLATLFPFKVVGVRYVAGGCR